MLRIKSILLVLVAILLPPPSYASSPPLVIVFAGQSNAQFGVVSEIGNYLPPEYLEIPPNVEYWREIDNPTTTVLGNLTSFAQEASFGPELMFMNWLGRERPEEQFIVVKMAHNGTDLATQWCNGCPLNLRLIEIVDWVVAGRTVEYAGLVWLQGETDTPIAGRAVAYKGNLATMISGLRTHFGAEIPVYIVPTDCPETLYPNMFLHTFHVSQSQYDYCRTDVACRIVSGNGLAKRDDKIHYSTCSMLELGTRIFFVWDGRLQ